VDLARLGRPRILLVAPGEEPPTIDFRTEDWVRVPADEKELFFRIQRLTDQAEPAELRPVLDRDDVLHVGGRWVALSSSEAAILRPMLVNFGLLVPNELLFSPAAEGEPLWMAAFASRLHRLRLRLRSVGLEIHRIRNRGVLLAAIDPPQEN
jgi:hypothetical protein